MDLFLAFAVAKTCKKARVRVEVAVEGKSEVDAEEAAGAKYAVGMGA